MVEMRDLYGTGLPTGSTSSDWQRAGEIALMSDLLEGGMVSCACACVR